MDRMGFWGGLWRDGDFVKFWVSRTVSNFGTLMGALQFVAVLALHATPFQMGMLGALGTIFAIGGISSIVGSIYAGWAARAFGFGKALVGGYAVYMLTILFIPVAQEPLLFAGLMLALAQLGDGFFTMFMVHESSLRQTITPERSLGRMNASIRSLGLAALFAGSLVGGWIAGVIGMRVTIVVAACIGILGALYMMMSPLRSVKQLN